MKYAKWMLLLVLATVIFSSDMFASKPLAPQNPYKAAQAAEKKGNYRDAYNLYRKALETKGAITAQQAEAALGKGVYCLQRLNQYNKMDEFVEAMLKVEHQKDNYYLVNRAAQYYRQVQHYGYIVAGEYHRGSHRGGGRWVYSTERDNMRALQLMERAEKLLVKCDVPVGTQANFYRVFAGYFLKQPWQMTALSDTSKLPDYGNGYRGGGRGYPVNAQGEPIYFFVPKSYQAAKNDGERWRWLLKKSSELRKNPNQELSAVANFAHGYLGVQTLRQYSNFFGRSNEADEKANQKGVWAIHTLTDTETIARTAGGIKRLTLPKEYQFVRYYRETKNKYTLAGIFENRRQYTEAAILRDQIVKEQNYPATIKNLESQLKVLEAQIKKGVPAKQKRSYDDRLRSVKKQLEMYRRVVKKDDAKLYVPMRDEHGCWQQLCQLRGNMGQFESVMTQPSGKGATLQYRFRNATKATFTAEEIDIEKLLTDCKNYIKSKPAKYNWQDWRNNTEVTNIGQRLISGFKTVPNMAPNQMRLNPSANDAKLQIGQIGYQLVKNDKVKYITKKTAEWSMDLKPRTNHWDKRITVTTPLQKAGAYLVTAKLANGNISKIIVWVADTVLVEKNIEKGKKLYYVADAITGKPIEKANIEFFAYRRHYTGNSTYRWDIKNFSEHTDVDGMAYLDNSKIPGNHSWTVLAMARTKAGRLAYTGFRNVWYNSSSASQPSVTRLFYLTDRPAYRPKQTVKWKFWYNSANYGKKNYDSPYAKRKAYVRIDTPRGEKAWDGYVTLDKFGGANGELALKAGCQLGTYRWHARWAPNSGHLGGGSFRVEEYKKPEYEVTVEAPKDPVALGETIKAKVIAKYYFGGAVTDAKVKYKVLRKEHSANWYPADHWDWLYGSGYWWFGYDYTWYPGWRSWGCKRPYHPWWGWRPTPQPELVAEGEAKIGKDGTFEIPIDTSLAKAMHPDRDHKYEITAEVRDASRRTIVGTGQVLVSRKPFKVHTWVDRGFYRVGDKIEVNYFARRLDGKAVSGKGSLKLYKIGYTTGKHGEPVPVETLEGTWNNDVDDSGKMCQPLDATLPGQYRVSCSVTDNQGHTIEGAQVFTVWGKGDTGKDYRYNGLELLPDRKNYKSGDTVSLRVNTAKRDSTVLLFTRCANGLCPTPKVLRLNGRSVAEAIKLTDVDMPNIFIEAVTIADGKVHNEIRQIAVPPKKRIAKIKIETDKTEYLPGKKAKVKLLVTDH
ncbi:MAG: hypothetical protein HN909_07285, partial [Phycisphaerales bacterium]|nr:hypothetical protein [Phycisphaerales bacterium]